MSHCLLLQHDPAFGPGRITPIFRDFGIPTKVCHVADDGLPDDTGDVRLLVVLGGPQRLTEADEYGPSPEWLQAEVDFVKRFADADRPTLGLGLGAQVLARACGADVTPLRQGEGDDATADPHLGWGTIKLPFPGGTDPLVFGLGDGVPMPFWQKDGFALPKLPPPPGYDPDKPGPPPPSGNLLLASSPWDRNAGFRFRNRLYGLAFQPEMTRDGFATLFRHHGGAIGAVYGSGSLDKVKAETERHYPRYERLANRLFENLVQFSRSYSEVA